LRRRNGSPGSNTVLRDWVELKGKQRWVGCHKLSDPRCINTPPQTWVNQSCIKDDGKDDKGGRAKGHCDCWFRSPKSCKRSTRIAKGLKINTLERLEEPRHPKVCMGVYTEQHRLDVKYGSDEILRYIIYNLESLSAINIQHSGMRRRLLWREWHVLGGFEMIY